MSLISSTTLQSITDLIGDAFNNVNSGIYAGYLNIQTLLSDVFSTSAGSSYFPYAADGVQAVSLYSTLAPLVQPANVVNAAGVAISTSTAGNSALSGIFNSQNEAFSFFSGIINTLNSDIQTFSNVSGVVDIPTAIAHYNIQVSSYFAQTYFYVTGTQLPAANVYAPAGIALAALVITGTTLIEAGPIIPWTLGNGYTTPAPSPDSYGNEFFVGGMSMAQGFYECKLMAKCTNTNVNGTAAITFSDINGTTFSVTADNATLGNVLTVTHSGYTPPYFAGLAETPYVTLAGTATAGVVTIYSNGVR